MTRFLHITLHVFLVRVHSALGIDTVSASIPRRLQSAPGPVGCRCRLQLLQRDLGAPRRDGRQTDGEKGEHVVLQHSSWFSRLPFRVFPYCFPMVLRSVSESASSQSVFYFPFSIRFFRFSGFPSEGGFAFRARFCRLFYFRDNSFAWLRHLGILVLSLVLLFIIHHYMSFILLFSSFAQKRAWALASLIFISLHLCLALILLSRGLRATFLPFAYILLAHTPPLPLYFLFGLSLACIRFPC